MSPVSVIIPTLNGAETIGEMLESLASQDYESPWELIVVDNGCTDNTLEIVAQYTWRLPSVRTVDASKRRGRAYAINEGVKVSIGEKLLFVDDDDKVSSNYISDMSRGLETADMVGASIDTIELGPPWGGGSASIEQGGIAGEFLPAISGGCLGVRRSVFESLGGFDERFRWSEDIDFSWRALLRSHSHLAVPSATLFYRARPTLRGVFSQARSRGFMIPLLYREYRHLGMPRRNLLAIPRFYLGPLRALCLARSKEDLAFCAYLLGFRFGLIRGSLRFRVLYL